MGEQYFYLPSALFEKFKQEVVRRGLSLSAEISDLKKKEQNARQRRREKAIKNALNIHVTSKIEMERSIALVLLMNDRLKLKLIDNIAPWNQSKDNQIKWLNHWRPLVEKAAVKKSGVSSLDDAVGKATKPC
jgi:hypothetical protein